MIHLYNIQLIVMLGDLKKIIFAFADEVQFKQIVLRCRLNNQIRDLSFTPVYGIKIILMYSRQFVTICYPEVFFKPTQLQIKMFPSL